MAIVYRGGRWDTTTSFNLRHTGLLDPFPVPSERLEAITRSSWASQGIPGTSVKLTSWKQQEIAVEKVMIQNYGGKRVENRIIAGSSEWALRGTPRAEVAMSQKP